MTLQKADAEHPRGTSCSTVCRVWAPTTMPQGPPARRVAPRLHARRARTASSPCARADLEWHTFFRNGPQILALAFPGVGIHMVLVAVVSRYAYPYDWSWVEAFLYGAIISATDPVAVVRLPHHGFL